MSKADEFNKDREQSTKSFFLITLYHLDYITVNYKTGDHIQIEADKELINQVKEMFTI